MSPWLIVTVGMPGLLRVTGWLERWSRAGPVAALIAVTTLAPGAAVAWKRLRSRSRPPSTS